ncbi:MAG: hypothetical protein ABIA04_00575 [Pseudomonadota bacterium]
MKYSKPFLHSIANSDCVCFSGTTAGGGDGTGGASHMTLCSSGSSPTSSSICKNGATDFNAPFYNNCLDGSGVGNGSCSAGTVYQNRAAVGYDSCVSGGTP